MADICLTAELPYEYGGYSMQSGYITMGQTLSGRNILLK